MVDVGAEKEGLVPISKMLGVPPNGSCFDCLKEGDQVNVWVSEISNPSDLRNSKLVLSTDKAKVSVAALPGPVANVSQFRSQLGKVWFNGTVSRLRAYGMFVVIAAPEGDGFIEGLVHKSEATYNATIGSELRVRALRIDTQKQLGLHKMSLISPLTGLAQLGLFQNIVSSHQRLHRPVEASSAAPPEELPKPSLLNSEAEELSVLVHADLLLQRAGSKAGV